MAVQEVHIMKKSRGKSNVASCRLIVPVTRGLTVVSNISKVIVSKELSYSLPAKIRLGLTMA